MDLRLIPGALLAVGLLAGCGGAQTAGEASTAATTPASSAPAASVPASAGLIAASAAACDEVNRLTREAMDGLTDPKPAHWENFAVALQNVANGSPDPDLRQALTDLATGALTASERLGKGDNVRDSVADFDNAIPALDRLCKAAGMPLN